ncbi:MAG: hypothetical protein ACREFD_14595 [Stellaceae bacterium]
MSERRLYAVIRSRGGAWKPDVPVEQQYDWQGHAQFMDGLHQEGFLVLAGPLNGTPEALLIVRASGEQEIKEKLEWDSWSANDILRTTRIAPWTIRIGVMSD